MTFDLAAQPQPAATRSRRCSQSPIWRWSTFPERLGGTVAGGRVAPTSTLGENGAGKSTLIKIMTGIQQQDAGEMQFDGQPVTRAPRRRMHSDSAWQPSTRSR